MRLTFTTVLLAVMVGSAAQAGVLSPGLSAQMDRMDDHEILKVFVVMKDQADVLAMDLALHDRKVSRAERHRSVVGSLRDVAAATKKDLVGDLHYRKADKAFGGVRGFTEHWIVNSVVLVAEVGVIREIAARGDVEVVEADLEFELIEPVMVKTAADKGLKSDKAGGFLAPGVEAVNAPRVWHELGFDGSGTIVANMDSGVDGSHPLLASRWRGNFAPAEECWRDHALTGHPNFPFDQHGHGTHTMGTLTGGSVDDTTGVAPGALWIASNAIYAGGSVAEFDNTVIAAFEFFADPDDDPTTSDDVPDVVQNSWGTIPNPSLGYTACDSRYWDAIDNCEAAGVVVTWSAGNEGPTKGSLRSPGDRAASPTNCFTVGSVGYAIPYVVSNFSSRGPSLCGGPYAIKPEVVAPGEDIISTYPDNQYAYMSGTSMAGPHVAGVVALMRQANPDIDVIDVKQILMDTAIDVGNSGEDSASGHGMVDAYAAVMAAMTDKAVVEGTVTDLATGLPLPGVAVHRKSFNTGEVTDAQGFYSLNMRSGSNEIEFTKYSYYPQSIPVDLATGETRILDIALEQRPMGSVSGTVYGPDDLPVNGALVYAKGVPVDSCTTGPDGYYEIFLPVFEDAAYELVASATDLAYVVEFIGLPSSRVIDFHLPYVIGDGFESGTLTAFPWETAGQVPMAVSLEEACEGLFSVKSGNISDEDTSELSLDYYVVGEGEISFDVKTESEAHYDGLLFYIDGVRQASWSGDTPWTRFSAAVQPGHHNFKWVYLKDYAVSYKRDAAWIDRVEFPGTGVAPIPRIQVDQTTISMAFNPGWADSTALAVLNDGGYRLDFTTRISAFPVAGAVDAGDLIDSDPDDLFSRGFLVGTDKSVDPTWATVNPSAGSLHPGVTRDLMVTFSGSGLDNGVHYALLEIMSNDPADPVHTVPLVLTLGGVSDVSPSVLPDRVTLQGAVPNPFNPATYVTYSLPMAGEVSLRIYDVSGRLIRDLESGPRSAGQHRQRWDGRDQSGLDVASGVYFVRLNAAGQMEMKSMLLLR